MVLSNACMRVATMAQTVTMVRYDKGPVAVDVEAMAMAVHSRSDSDR
jgi:hypothetical protein